MDFGKKLLGSFIILLVAAVCWAADSEPFEKAPEAERIRQMREEAERAKREAARQAFEEAMVELEAVIDQVDLPADTTTKMTVKEIRLSGNTLISTDEIFDAMPLVYNESDKPLTEAESKYLYDFRTVKDVILNPGTPRQISARTIQGLTRYILSVYRRKHYGGIYVYVPAEAVIEGVRLRDDILPIEVLEAAVAAVTIKTYDPNQVETEKGYLRRSAVEAWSPVKVGKVANQKKLDEFVNLLNLNPDRYVSATISQGPQPKSLAVRYDIYEANPWHWFIQVDNSGTKERQWNPRVGVINTNLFGFDDAFSAIYQAPWDSTIDENYSIYGSYDIPVWGPGLRLSTYGGHNEFDITPETGPTGFLGRGSFFGSMLRYNFLQTGGWFFDAKGGFEYTRSKVTPSLFPSFLGTDIKFWLARWGLDIHRRTDIDETRIQLDWYESLGGKSDADEFNLARTNSDSDFAIYTASATHSRYLDPNKVNRVSGNFRWIGSDERLVPAKMTAFGGMYSIRGYDEYEFVADGGILASVQYEFDIVKYQKTLEPAGAEESEQSAKPFVRKLAPLAFFDYGRAKIKDHLATEKSYEELMSVGGGLIVELGDNFSGAVYYGYPLNATDSTREGKGHVNAGFMWRW